MKENTYILFTAGRGPVECGLALHGAQLKFKKFLKEQNIHFQIVKQQLGQLQHSMETIVFKIDRDKFIMVKPWLGTIQWICNSPVRKFSKRKNWYIKCCEISMPETVSIDIKDIAIQAYKSSGPGGQHRNKVETAIRVIHKPSGIIVTAADSKSKMQNKKHALEKLNKKLTLVSKKIQANHDLDEWSSKIKIERGNPSKVLTGLKFKEISNRKHSRA